MFNVGTGDLVAGAGRNHGGSTKRKQLQLVSRVSSPIKSSSLTFYSQAGPPHAPLLSAMSLLMWNCRGLGRPSAARALREIIKETDPIGIFLMEIKVKDGVVYCVMKKIGFSFFLSIPPVGLRVGLLFCWRPELQFSVLWNSTNILHLQINLGSDYSDFLCSLIYGPPLWRDKEQFWNKLTDLAQGPEVPGVCVGDFNDLLGAQEKLGGRAVKASSSRGLSHFMSSMGFVDLGYSGSRFTWSNKCLGLANIRERIDRAIANVPWRIAYPNATIHHYKIAPSDHTSIILRFLGYEPSMPKPFKFESLCVREKASFAVVTKS
ncbi:hypothetical protein CJ030_MR5G015919 [Morella rubra]|uniref:Endonuclease/exonuclease/phosphatase domain-containing protein n=1 Tax=Morella rubra TaxID=262757 RepID=A0A6A1VK35_9ROSI|nr:hypothetical protein CJ030_MR5G015919 [Morella rubra]